MNESALHTFLHPVLIYGHAVGGLVAFGLGCLVLRPRKADAVFHAYFVALWAMVLLLVAVVGVDWRELPPVSRLTYSGLTLLAFYTGFRGVQARRLLRHQTVGWKGDYIAHVGFTLISLFDGFVIVGALDMNAPSWLVGAVGVLGVSTVNYYKRAARLSSGAADASTLPATP